MPDNAAATATALRSPIANADCRWDEFDSRAYVKRNYAAIHELDLRIIAVLGKFFQSVTPGAGWRGIDVGSGSNLYPALAMMPLTQSVTLAEHSAANLKWLRQSVGHYGRTWDPFWEALQNSAELYQSISRPRSMLANRARVQKASVFELPESQWDIGTMFFVAESITGRYEEFEIATERFLRSLKPGAPFAAAFMEESMGYRVGRQDLPAVAVAESDVRQALEREAAQFQLDHIASPQQFRAGYDGMILVTGYRNSR